jgi:hypothetical protein
MLPMMRARGCSAVMAPPTTAAPTKELKKKPNEVVRKNTPQICTSPHTPTRSDHDLDS